MGISFDPKRWDYVKETSGQWWKGALDRPLIQIRVRGSDPERPKPELPVEDFTCAYSFDTSPEAIVDRWDYDLSCTKYLGDAFPCVWPNFGPGVIAALLGAELRNTDDTAWFLPRIQQEIADIHFEYDPGNPWLNRLKDLYRSALDRWQGLVQLSMTDLGGNLDILSTFRPSERLLVDLYDSPDDVKRLTWEAHKMWFKYFEEFNRIIEPTNPGYTGWSPIFSDNPCYMLQCDFCYMISPEMFDEFVKPELTATCGRLTNPFYHLDGPGQLPHLDSLLGIQGLKGVQWVPGDGQPGITEWPDVYRKIRNAGKLIQIYAGQSETGYRALDVLSNQLGDAKGIIMIAEADANEEDDVREFLSKYDVDTIA